MSVPRSLVYGVLVLGFLTASLVAGFATLSLSAAPATAKNAGVVNVYSYRQPFLVEPLFAKFREQTGIEVKVIFAKKGLIERVATEGRALTRRYYFDR